MIPTLTSSPNTKNQHYVWRYYLTAWEAGGAFCCYRHKDRRIFATQPSVVASERYFYESRKLTSEDRAFLNDVIEKTPSEELRKLHRNFVDLNQMTFALRDYVDNAGGTTPTGREAIESELRWAERNLVERYHAGIENKCQDILDALRRENDAFYISDDRCADFTYFIALQYFRTAKMRNAINDGGSALPGHDPERTTDILTHLYATNVGAALYRERKAFRPVFLRNETATPFVTGDQPVLNMLDPIKDVDIELYYPVSPSVAVVLTKRTQQFPIQRRLATRLEVENYNYAIYSKSEDQVYSNTESYLRELVAIGKSLLSA